MGTPRRLYTSRGSGRAPCLTYREARAYPRGMAHPLPFEYSEAERIAFIERFEPSLDDEERAAIRAERYPDWWIDYAIAVGG